MASQLIIFSVSMTACVCLLRLLPHCNKWAWSIIRTAGMPLPDNSPKSRHWFSMHDRLQYWLPRQERPMGQSTHQCMLRQSRAFIKHCTMKCWNADLMQNECSNWVDSGCLPGSLIHKQGPAEPIRKLLTGGGLYMDFWSSAQALFAVEAICYIPTRRFGLV